MPNIQTVCKDYFNLIRHPLKEQSKTGKALTAAAILSCLTLIIPAGFAVAFGLAKLIGKVKKVENHPDISPIASARFTPTPSPSPSISKSSNAKSEEDKESSSQSSKNSKSAESEEDKEPLPQSSETSISGAKPEEGQASSSTAKNSTSKSSSSQSEEDKEPSPQSSNTSISAKPDESQASSSTAKNSIPKSSSTQSEEDQEPSLQSSKPSTEELEKLAKETGTPVGSLTDITIEELEDLNKLAIETDLTLKDIISLDLDLRFYGPNKKLNIETIKRNLEETKKLAKEMNFTIGLLVNHVSTFPPHVDFFEILTKRLKEERPFAQIDLYKTKNIIVINHFLILFPLMIFGAAHHCDPLVLDRIITLNGFERDEFERNIPAEKSIKFVGLFSRPNTNIIPKPKEPEIFRLMYDMSTHTCTNYKELIPKLVLLIDQNGN
jgi:hypothetical protein